MANRAMATFYLSTRRAPEAETYLRAAAETDTNPAAPLKLALADYYVSVDRHDAATTHSEELAKHPPSARPPAHASRCSRTSTRATRRGTARSTRVLASRSARRAGDAREGALPALQDGKTDEALARARAAVGIDPSSVQAHYLLGSIHRLRGDIGVAMGAFNDVLRLNPRVAAAQVELARLNLATGRADAALQLSESAAREVPEDADVQLTLARSLLANGQVRRAEPIVRTLVSRFPQSPAAVATLGILQAQTARQLRRESRLPARWNSIRPASMPLPGWRRSISPRSGPIKRAPASTRCMRARCPRARRRSCLPRASTARRAIGPRAEALLKTAIDARPVQPRGLRPARAAVRLPEPAGRRAGDVRGGRQATPRARVGAHGRRADLRNAGEHRRGAAAVRAHRAARSERRRREQQSRVHLRRARGQPGCGPAARAARAGRSCPTRRRWPTRSGGCITARGWRR